MDYQLAASLWQQLRQGLRGPGDATAPPTFLDTATFSSAFAVSELAAASIGLATQAAVDFIGVRQPVSVNVRLASRWFQTSFFPRNRPAPALWDAFAGDYRSADGWIRLHTNAPHHRAAMERVLGQHPDRDALARQGTIADQLGANRRFLNAAADTYRLTEASYRGGVTPFLNTLDAQRSLYSAQRTVIATQLTAATNRVTLYRVLGGDSLLETTPNGPVPLSAPVN